MKKSKIYLLLCLFFFTIHTNAQESISTPFQSDKITVGIGGGMDFGGFGANVLVYPQKNFGLFAGAGYAIAGFGFNAGAKIRLVSNKPTSKFSPYALAMYGYNAAIAVTNADQYNKLFYGPSVGIGFDYSKKPEKKGYLSIALLIPLRKPEVESYMDNLTRNHGVQFQNDLPPVGISIGYRIIIDNLIK
ncbi:hypothetical protein ACFLTI_10500 [Bacteroidota bacterium]